MTAGAGTCKSCKAPVIWVTTEPKPTDPTKNKPPKPARRMPLDADPENPSKALKVDNGNILFTGRRAGDGSWYVRYVRQGPELCRSHFATCPERDQHRKARR